MGKNLSALFLCLLMIASSLAGCMGTGDSADDSAVAELENELISIKDDKIAELEAEVTTLTSIKDDKIAELEAEVTTLTTQHQEAMAELATVQSTLQTTQTSLDSAEANTSMHKEEISSLEAERDMAQAEISMLYELMSNMSDQSNETYESMTLYIAELNQHVSNLSSMLNVSSVRHQENATLVDSLITQQSELSAELSNITSQLSVANLTISQLRDEIDRLSGEDYFQGLLNGSEPSTKFRDLNSVMLDPIHYGSPTLTIENQGFETYMNYSTSMNRSHTLWFELCNSSIGMNNGIDWFPRALGINYTSNSNNYPLISNYNSTVLLNLTFDFDGPNAELTTCLVWSTTPNENGTTNFVYPNFDLLSIEYGWVSNNPVELRVFSCMQSGPDMCTSEHNWLERGSGNAMENYSIYGFEEHLGDFLHPIETGFAVPVDINDNSCLMNRSISGRTGCPPPDCISSFDNGGSSPCSIHIIDWGTGSGTYNYDLYNLTNLIADFSTGSSTHNIYICDSQFYANVSMSTGSNNVRIYSYGWGAGNNVTIDSSYNTGTLNGNGNRSVDYYMGVSSISLSVYEWADGAWSC